MQYGSTQKALREIADTIAEVNSILTDYTERRLSEYLVMLKAAAGTIDRLLADSGCAIKSIFEVIEAYIVIYDKIEAYCSLLRPSATVNVHQLASCKIDILAAQQRFERAKSAYGAPIDTFQDMLTELQGRLSDEQNRLNNLLAWEERSHTGEEKCANGLPRRIEIGTCPAMNLPISIDVERRGNMIINTDKTADAGLVKTVSAIILQYLKSFPIGSLRVKIVDPDNALTTSYRFKNGFASGESSLCKNIVTDVNGEVRELLSQKGILEATKNDVQGKLVGSIKNLYDLYTEDETVHFTLVVIASGLASQLEYSGNGLLSQLSGFMDSSKIHHRCGVRFLVINDYKQTESYGALRSDALAAFLGSADAVVDYADGKYMIDGQVCSMQTVDGDCELTVEDECRKLANALSAKKTNTISYEQTGFGERGNGLDACYKIPVGVAGTKTVYMPFSCGAKNETDEGANIGFMIIGQSGYGKSSLFHSLIINGCMRYSPEELQFWLIDFKDGVEANRYYTTPPQLPHVKVVAPQSKLEDAYCIFKILLGEINRRNDLFKSVGKNKIDDYNNWVVQSGISGQYEFLPRIIVVIDEAQTMLSAEGELKTQIFGLIKEITTKSRSSGIHFTMFAQDLNDGMSLKDSFVGHINGRVTFKLDADKTREAGFGELFTENSSQIEQLDRGETYFTYSKKTIEKVKITFTDDFAGYFAKIVERYPTKAQILKIGESELLSPNTVSSKHERQFEQYIAENRAGEEQRCAVGEDCYTLDPVQFTFSRKTNCACAFYGSEPVMASSLMTSLLLQLNKPQNALYIADGKFDDEELPFATACRELKSRNAENCKVYGRAKDIDLMIKEIWQEYTLRQRDREEGVAREYQPTFVFINDIESFEKYNDNVTLRFKQADEGSYYSDLEEADENGIADIYVKSALSTLFKQGYRVGIYLIVSLSDDNKSVFTDHFPMTNNLVFFNRANLDIVGGNYILKELLAAIRAQEAFAYARLPQGDTKIRPILYSKDEDFKFLKEALKEDKS